MSRIMSGFLSATVGSMVAITFIAAGGAGPSSAAPSHRVTPATAQGIEAQAAQRASLVRSISTLSPFVTQNADGTMSMTAPAGVLASVPTGDLNVLNQSLASVNQQVKAGELMALPGGSVLPAGTNPLILSGGGYTYWGCYWWGCQYCISHNDIKNAWQFGWYSAPVLAVIARLSPEIGIGVTALIAEFVAVDQLGGSHGACIDLLNNSIVVFFPQP